MFEIEVQHGVGRPWTEPSLGGNFFDTVEAAENAVRVLKEYDADYYAGCYWRIVKVTREVVKEVR